MLLAKQAAYVESPKIHELSLENLTTKNREDQTETDTLTSIPSDTKIHRMSSGTDKLDPPVAKYDKFDNSALPSSPTSFKVSPSETSDDTNETSPSSIEQHDDDETADLTTDQQSLTLLMSTKTNETQKHAKFEDLQQHHQAPENKDFHKVSQHIDFSVNRAPAINKDIHDIDPHHIPTPEVDAEKASNMNTEGSYFAQPLASTNNNNKAATTSSSSIANPYSLRNRRHTTPAPSTTAMSNNTTSVNTNQSNQYSRKSSHTSNSVQNLHGSSDAFVPKPPIATNTFPSAASNPMATNFKSRSRTSMDNLNNRRNSTNSEILRMRNSILVRRNMKKKRKEFLEDEKVLVGNKISEGHENFVMAYNMLTGIRVAVSRCSGIMKKISDEDFNTTKKLSFNMDGSELTPSSKYDFKFKDYCPEVFRELRSMFGLDPADYLVSITGKYILSELGSPGKSGSFFYYSRDYRFIIKTIHHAEHKQLRRILQDYYEHVKTNPNTLISQIYGLHRVKIPAFGAGSNGGKSRKVHFMVMNNLFPPHRDIHVKYDLKGSTWGRLTKLKNSEEKQELLQEELSSHTLKDLNWLERNDQIKFGPAKKKLFFDQLDSDVKFLEKINVMDYSLLLGIHDVKKGNSANTQKLSIFDPKSTNKADLINTNPRDIDRINDLPTNVFPGRSQYVFYGHDGGIRSTNAENEPLNEIYYLGIIDCLTNYSMKKRMETFWRSLSHSRQTISAVPAKEYGERFLKFIKNGVLTPKKAT